MRTVRVIPVLLLDGRRLVKTERFSKPHYLGDPVNIVKIFNEKEVDEIAILDITATKQNRAPQIDLLEEIASECFMPLCYGGGVRSIEDIRRLLSIGIEKVSINSYAAQRPEFIREAADTFGSQSVVVSIDVKTTLFGRYEVYIECGTRRIKRDPADYAVEVERMGAGEILLNSIDLDGTMRGYDINLITMVSDAVGIPVIACGGAGRVEDFREAVQRGGASAVAAGSLFVFEGKHRAVLIKYPSAQQLEDTFAFQK